MNTVSFYRLECWNCSQTINLPAQDGPALCPNCKAGVCLEWNGARVELKEYVRWGSTFADETEFTKGQEIDMSHFELIIAVAAAFGQFAGPGSGVAAQTTGVTY
jgi:hypothetical protein